MSRTQSITISLPDDLAEMLRAKVVSGEYASESNVVGDGLRSLAECNDKVEQWLVDEVLPALDRIDADPSRVVPARDAWNRIEVHMGQGRTDRNGQ